MAVLWEYLEKNGRMVDVYTDRHAMFAVTPRKGESQAERIVADRLTQIGRGLRELGIGWIAAPSHPPKAVWNAVWDRSGSSGQAPAAGPGRDDGSGQCLSGDRVLAGVECALRTAPSGLSQPASSADALSGPGRNSVPRQPRVIGNDYTFSFAGRRYQIAREEAQAGMRHQRLRVELRLNGSCRRAIKTATCTSASVAPRRLLLHRRCANRCARITTRAAKAPGCRASWIAPARRYGNSSATETSFCAPGRARRASRWIAQSLRSGVSPEALVVQEGPPRRPVETTRV